jgi:hypothetical protein
MTKQVGGGEFLRAYRQTLRRVQQIVGNNVMWVFGEFVSRGPQRDIHKKLLRYEERGNTPDDFGQSEYSLSPTANDEKQVNPFFFTEVVFDG